MYVTDNSAYMLELALVMLKSTFTGKRKLKLTSQQILQGGGPDAVTESNLKILKSAT